MSKQDRDEEGQFTEKVTLDDVLGLFDSEPLTATEVGDTLDISNRAALNKLNELHDCGEIERKEVGARAIVWWRE